MTIRVVDPDGQPIEGAVVFRNYVHMPEGAEQRKIENETYRTDAEGNTRVKLPGRNIDLRLFVSRQGFVPLHAMWAPQLQSDGHQIPDEFTFPMQSGTRIGGVVKNERGEPIAGVHVEVKDQTATQFHLSNSTAPGVRPVRSMWLAEHDNKVVTDDQGRWELDSVPADEDLRFRRGERIALGLRPKLQLKLSHPDYESSETWGDLQSDREVDLKSLRDQAAVHVMTSKKASAPAQDQPDVDEVSYLVIPLPDARTELQSTLVSSRKGAEVLVDGTAIVSDEGRIDGSRLPLERLREDLRPWADRDSHVLEVHIYHRLVGEENAKDLLMWSLQGFGRHAGFKRTKVYNHYQGQRFRFADLLESRKKQIADEEVDDEPQSGDELVKVYPVRTSLSRSKTGNSDCVVDIVPRFRAEPADSLAPEIEQAIRRYVAALKVDRRRKLLFRVTSQGQARQTVDWFVEEKSRELARDLGYEDVSVRHTPYGDDPSGERDQGSP